MAGEALTESGVWITQAGTNVCTDVVSMAEHPEATEKLWLVPAPNAGQSGDAHLACPVGAATAQVAPTSAKAAPIEPTRRRRLMVLAAGLNEELAGLVGDRRGRERGSGAATGYEPARADVDRRERIRPFR